MGHYLSETPKDRYIPPKKQALKDKLRREGSSYVDVEGSTEGVVVVEEYVVYFERYDAEAIRNFPRDERGGTPVGWWLAPSRITLTSRYRNTDEEIIETGTKYAREFQSKEALTPARIMRRTVTYGPWEILAEVGE